MTRRAPLSRPALRMAPAVILALMLPGCFAHTADPAFGPERREAVTGLPGVYAATAASNGAALRHAAVFEIREEAWGVYRMIGGPASLDPDMLASMRALTGDCTQLDSAEDRAECERPDAGVCASETDAKARAACLGFMAALRGQPSDHPMSLREWGAVEAVRWVAEGLPYRDEVIFTTRPLSPSGDDGEPTAVWAAAQARRVVSTGPFTDFEILSPQILPLDLLLIRVDVDGLFVFSTQNCADADPSGDALAPSDPEALEAMLTACAARAQIALKANDADSLQWRYFERSD